MSAHVIRQMLLRLATGQREIALTREAPSRQQLRAEFDTIDSLGIYLHIPFCEQICPYCPYNKELYRQDKAQQYAEAVKKEVNAYADIIGKRPITSLYIGGGTPTTMLHSGLAGIIAHIRALLNVQCDLHMESHPNHLSSEHLALIRSMGVKHLSIGVEALQDRHLTTLCRPYTASTVRRAVERAVSQRFECVNVDVMFALPGQTLEEIAAMAQSLVEMDVDQIAAYPLFRFPYTAMGSTGERGNYGPLHVIQRRRMLKVLERRFYEAGYERTSVWAFTKRGVPSYCSVTVPLYLGLGASGGSYLRSVFYLNTFSAGEYIKLLESDRLPIALSVQLSEKMQEAGWLYWRIYETSFRKANYKERFGADFDQALGRYMRLLGLIGFLKDDGEWIRLSDRGAFWLHALEDLFSIHYTGALWGTSKRDPWPDKVRL